MSKSRSLREPLFGAHNHSPPGTSPLFPRPKLFTSPDTSAAAFEAAGAIREEPGEPQSTNLQTGFNVVNTYIGSERLWTQPSTGCPTGTFAPQFKRVHLREAIPLTPACHSPVVLLSQSFCFAQSGWLAMPLLAILTAFGAYTGMLVVESYRIIAEKESAPSFAQSAHAPSNLRTLAISYGV